MTDSFVKSIQAIARCRPLLKALVLVFTVMAIITGFGWRRLHAVETKVEANHDATDRIETKLDLLIDMQERRP